MRAWRKRSREWRTAILQWGYRLAGGFLQCRLQAPRRKSRKKVVTGATLQPTATQKNAVWSWDSVHVPRRRGRPSAV
ncbi:hypothetical protein [Candidatus Nitrospira neomarina]|uniref:Uncharacterized protein n=1 Tax=Candidatus Nitrospira neomarina TaxID=3020899 RepID=A0AA96GDT7_9BACT|nr:hypothetical protein [Candidatus Nitrospira neomarina]WNM60309.1 hypothetical protein PQG83_11095 [Candidatus Nitrospira neomarina]